MAGSSRIRILSLVVCAGLASYAVSYVGDALAEGPAPVLDATAPAVDASLKDPEAAVPSGGWVTIRGRDLAPLSRTWTDKDFQAGRAPIILEGVSVAVEGKAAFVAALRRGADSGLDSDEIDAVLPKLAEGTASLTVTTPGGTTEAATIRVVEFQPSLFAHPVAKDRFVKAETRDGSETIGPFDLFGGQPLDRPVRPAIAQEVVQLTANSCGALERPVEDGMRTDERIALALPVVVKFGEQSGEVLFAGSSLTAPGLCEIEVKVPALATGEYEVLGSIGEKALAGSRYIVAREVEYPGFSHGLNSKFRLSGAHHFVNCTSCHVKSRFWGTPQACEACHLDRYRATTAPDHQASNFPQDCSQCHVTSRFKGARGGHTASSKFLLTGRHAEAGCAACHKGGEFAKLDTACVSCHLANYESTSNPDHASTGLGKDCAVCHTPAGWAGARTDHSQTKFALTGKHAKASCNACHVAGQTGRPPVECVACHRVNYEATTSPNHVAAGYPAGCDACHTTESFKPAKVDHPRQRFPLTGKHAPLQCAQCHKDGTLTSLNPACASCHLDVYKSAVNPNHVALGYPQSCETCHTAAGFAGASIKHDKFALTGRHVQTACTACHRDSIFSGTARSCAGCHLDRYDATTKPAHRTQGYPTDCQLCHSTSQFTGALFQHANFFQLEGKHASVQCAQCHAGDRYKGTPRDCAGCHSATYASTSAPNHPAQGFPTSCQNCHTPAGWKPANFAHTSFALTGKHATTECSKCHVGGKYAGTSRDCSGCHTAAYNATTTPNHQSQGFPTACQNCHSPAGWKPSSFAHTTFQLAGRHSAVQCSSCHVSGQYAGTKRDCYGCHTANFNSAANPNHALLGYPTSCQSCHTPVGWRPASFDHATFALTGKHLAAQCSKCHAGGVYAGTQRSCSGCHMAAYSTTSNPNHVQAGFPATCETCHTTAGWKPASFAHTKFTLTGAHTTASCSQCHVGGQYAGTVNQCSGCHMSRYSTASNPNHALQVYPTACQSCHTPAYWRPASFSHKFPIASGKHQGKWTRCTDCHIQPTDFKVFSCFQCHTKSKMDDKHQNRAGYAYDSARCYQCHPQGKGD